MALAFSRSVRALDADRSFGGALFWIAMLGLSAAWLGWFVLARVQVLATSERARIEVSQTGHRVQAAVSGRVVRSHQSLERWVTRGELLLELDTSLERGELAQKQVALRDVRAELTALKQQMFALTQVVTSQQQATRLHLDEAELRKEQAEALAQFRELERARNTALRDLGALAAVAAQKSISEAEQQRREAQNAALVIDRVRADRAVAEAERSEQQSALRKQATTLQGRIDALAGEIAHDEQEIERRKIRAPITGRLGDVAALTAGSFVQVGDTLSTIVPEGQLRIVTDFPPDQAVGRIRPGQPARMRLFGFPWTQFGTLHAVVEHVARETREDRVRVELSVDASGTPAVRLRHGMTGSLEIVLEDVSPVELAWRAAGRRNLVTQPDSKP